MALFLVAFSGTLLLCNRTAFLRAVELQGVGEEFVRAYLIEHGDIRRYAGSNARLIREVMELRERFPRILGITRSGVPGSENEALRSHSAAELHVFVQTPDGRIDLYLEISGKEQGNEVLSIRQGDSKD